MRTPSRQAITFMTSIIHELRDLDQARWFLWQGLWLQRALTPSAARVRTILEWCLEVASTGQALPPIGFVADLGHAALGAIDGDRAVKEGPEVPGFPAGLARTYEDYVLGKVYADWTFERAADALRRYQGRDRARALAYIIHQFRERADLGGVLLSPAVIKGMLATRGEDILAQGWESLTRDGLLPLLPQMYEALIAGARRTAEMLGNEDLFELEHGTALAEMGQRVALRQVLQAADQLAAGLVRRGRAGQVRRLNEVPTRILDEDTYPVGGFASISTRGSIESLLHSQLAYMETDERPDLFDVKFLRDELLYYSRDENQFLRRRRTFVFVLDPDLVQSRFKDAELPWQRGVLLLALLLTAVRKLSEWLSTDALVFEFLFVQESSGDGLAAERELLETLLREQLANGTALVERVAAFQVPPRCAQRARRSLCHCLSIAARERRLQADGIIVTRLTIDGPRPALGFGAEPASVPQAEGAVESWGAALESLLEVWM